jgi:hypothetical protein
VQSRLFLLLAVLTAACGGRPSSAQCDQVADRMLDILAAPPVPASGQVAAEVVTATDSWKKLLKERDPAKGLLSEMCRKQMSGGHATCILESADEPALARCFSEG